MIASASVVYKDPVLFQNTSYGATNYQWFVSDNTGANFFLMLFLIVMFSLNTKCNLRNPLEIGMSCTMILLSIPLNLLKVY
jgi:hypothetical protein